MWQFFIGVLVGIWAHKLYAGYHTRQRLGRLFDELLLRKRDRERERDWSDR